ncbi:MAG: PAS domain-containing protein [Gemmatimonadaceae bacterium]|nr:PAS domain-containing protein [Chitinophagaceae bacterium]
MPKANKDKIKILSDNLFPVVGVGASAGGLDAFQKLLHAIPEDSGMAYILVQHLDPSHESILVSLLQKVTRIPVEEVIDNIKVEPDHIYIIPTNKLLTATDGVLQLSARPPKNYKNMPIDLFFTSLSDVHQAHAIGVVLSGNGSDGTLGLQAIKDKGGLTIVQDLDSAANDSMPRSVIDAGLADFSLSPEKIPQQLIESMKDFKAVAMKPQTEEQLLENKFREIISLMRVRKSVDFTYYKQTTIRRRISRRIAITQNNDIGEYLEYLRKKPEEQDILYNDLLISVTGFFRDPGIFKALSEKLITTIIKGRAKSDTVRIWVPGCSTGEEVYSIMMCLQPLLAKKSMHLQLFATDISEPVIKKARAALYSKKELTGVSPVRLAKFFTKESDGFRVNKIIRDNCIFANHNYLKDPPFARMDIISCRNSLIYLQPTLQKKALTTFHYALKENGFLILGKSETTAQAADLFGSYDKTNKIYKRKPGSAKYLNLITGRGVKDQAHHQSTEQKNDKGKEDYLKSADEVLLRRFAPPGVTVNNDMEIVQFRGATGVWLESSPGKPNFNLLKMIREEIAFEMRNLLHKAKKSGQGELKENIQFKFQGAVRMVTIEVIPLLNTSENHWLVLFHELAIDAGFRDQKNKKKLTGTQQSDLLSRDKRIMSLEKELVKTRDDMRTITEDQEAANEELQSANEELLSGSEELQSLNEELETSKEEIQTTNEELITLNNELVERNEQLDHSRRYSDSIVSTLREPLVILNHRLAVRSANRAFYNKFKLQEDNTLNVPFLDLSEKSWDSPALKTMLEKLLRDKTSIEDFEIRKEFPGLGERVMLLNATRIVKTNGEGQSILIAIEDVTLRKKADAELHHFSGELEKLVAERTLALNDSISDLRYSNKNLEQFAYIASHDLQEPLRKINTYSLMLQDGFASDLPESAKSLVTKITSSSQRMSTLIKDVLNFSKILHGEDAYQETDLKAIVARVVDDCELLIMEKKAVIKFGSLPKIEAIPLQINQLFYNLVSNSLKFAKKDTDPRIDISCKKLTHAELKKFKHLDQELVYYDILFKDNGIGFDQQYADQIFLIFQRLHSSAQYSGTGIGLALCKSIVINHHGEITGSSTSNKGACFRIILPVKQP